MNQKSKAREIHQQVALTFNPERLSNFIKFDDAIPIVDKAKLLESVGDESLFCIALNSIFHWDYSTDLKHTTVFFEVGGDIIFAGAYDEINHTQLTRFPIATVKNGRFFAPYTYTEGKFSEIRNNLTKES